MDSSTWELIEGEGSLRLTSSSRLFCLKVNNYIFKSNWPKQAGTRSKVLSLPLQ